jgi:hypothetical protein
MPAELRWLRRDAIKRLVNLPWEQSAPHGRHAVSATKKATIHGTGISNSLNFSEFVEGRSWSPCAREGMAEARGFAGDGILKRTGETPHLRQILCATKSDKLSEPGKDAIIWPPPDFTRYKLLEIERQTLVSSLWHMPPFLAIPERGENDGGQTAGRAGVTRAGPRTPATPLLAAWRGDGLARDGRPSFLGTPRLPRSRVSSSPRQVPQALSVTRTRRVSPPHA